MYVLRVKVITDVMGWMNEVIKRIKKKNKIERGRVKLVARPALTPS